MRAVGKKEADVSNGLVAVTGSSVEVEVAGSRGGCQERVVRFQHNGVVGDRADEGRSEWGGEEVA